MFELEEEGVGEECAGSLWEGRLCVEKGELVEAVTGEWRRTQCTWGLLGNSVLGRTQALTQCPQQTTVVWAPEPQQDTGSE